MAYKTETNLLRPKAIDIARNLKAANLDINFIAENTGLTIDEITEL